jgi:hypothetical protein
MPALLGERDVNRPDIEGIRIRLAEKIPADILPLNESELRIIADVLCCYALKLEQRIDDIKYLRAMKEATDQ